MAPRRPPRKRPISTPAVRPAATASMPTKWSRSVLGRSERIATTHTPRARSLVTSSRSCGVSSARMAIPSSSEPSMLRRMRTSACGSPPGTSTTRASVRSATGVPAVASTAALIEARNEPPPTGSTKAKRYWRLRARLAAATSRT